MTENLKIKTKLFGDQDGRGIGGHGEHLFPWIHEQYTFRQRSECKTPAESRQENLTSGKEYLDPHKTH